MDAVARHFAAHHGVISRDEALKLALSKRTISRRLEQRRWIELHRGVYRLAGAPRTWLGDARAASLACDGVISHRGAARVWRIDGFDRSRVELTVEVSRSPKLSDRVVVHRSTQMRLADRTIRSNVPVTSPARTILDVAAVVPRHRLDAAVDSALRRRLLRWQDLQLVLLRHSRQGRDGCGKLRALLDDRLGEGRPPDSVFNRMVGQLFADAGLGPFSYEYELWHRGRFLARVDIAFPEHHVAIELDSRAFHDNEISFVDDRRRANRIVNLGWRLLAFTWDDLRDNPNGLVRTVHTALRSAHGSAGTTPASDPNF